MSTSTEKMKINRTRKRIYEMQEEAEETPLPEETVASPELAMTDTAEVAVTTNDPMVGPSTPGLESAVEVTGSEMEPAISLREVTPLPEEQHVSATVEAVSDSEIAIDGVASADTTVEETVGAYEKEREQQKLHDLLHQMLQDDVAEPELGQEAIIAPESGAAMESVTEVVESGTVEQGDSSATDGNGTVPEQKDDLFPGAMNIVYTYSAVSAATGLIPIPLVDMAGFMTTQLLMLRKLSALYGIPFDSQRSKSAIAVLASGINSAYLAASSSKLIPFIGAFSVAAMPAVNGALSYAVGRVFIQHFASGGTFLDFDPEKVRSFFEEQFRAGKVNR